MSNPGFEGGFEVLLVGMGRGELGYGFVKLTLRGVQLRNDLLDIRGLRVASIIGMIIKLSTFGGILLQSAP